MLKRILAPIDFSVGSAGAVEFATRLASTVSAEIVVCHAYAPTGITQQGIEELGRQVDAFLPNSLRERVKRVLHPGSPGEVICWLAQSEASDMIVIGSHGHAGLLHRLLGGTTEYVLEHARVPVLIVPARPIEQTPLPEPLGQPLPAPRLM